MPWGRTVLLRSSPLRAGSPCPCNASRTHRFDVYWRSRRWPTPGPGEGSVNLSSTKRNTYFPVKCPTHPYSIQIKWSPSCFPGSQSLDINRQISHDIPISMRFTSSQVATHWSLPGRHPRASPSHPNAPARPGAPRANACAPWWLQRRSSHRLAWSRGSSPEAAGSCWELENPDGPTFVRGVHKWFCKNGGVVCVEIKLKWFAGWQEAAWQIISHRSYSNWFKHIETDVTRGACYGTCELATSKYWLE